MGVIVWSDDRRETTIKGNDDSGWSSDSVVLWLGRMQNRDMIEWWGDWSCLRWSFYSSGGWESGGSGRVACCGGADLMLWFRLETGDDGMKHYWKIKWSQPARLVQWKESVTRCGGMVTSTRGEAALGRKNGGDDASWVDVNLTRPKMKKMHMVDLAVLNGRWRFKATMNYFFNYMQVRSSFVHLTV
jgi:hypothetical protein